MTSPSLKALIKSQGKNGYLTCLSKFLVAMDSWTEAQLQVSLCTEGKQQYIGKVGTNFNENEKCWPFQGGVTALRGPCKRQIQCLKSRCIWNRRVTVLQLWLCVTKLSVSNSNCYG